VSRSKTEGGTGRVVPLTNRARQALSAWLTGFPSADADSYVFPFHRIGLAGSDRRAWLWDVKLDRPMGQCSYKSTFDTAQRQSGVVCRFYDARHTFVTRLAENPRVPIETIRQLAAHVNDRMLARYAHIRAQARREAIATLERRPAAADPFENGGRWAQNWAQSPNGQQQPSRRGDSNPSKRKDLSMVGVAGFEPATTRTPNVEKLISPVSPVALSTRQVAVRQEFLCFRRPTPIATERCQYLPGVPTKVPTARKGPKSA
jgi:hypothetical protein